MATARDMINGALRLLGRLQSGEVATANEAADGLESLNQMLHAWRDQGIDLEHADLTLNDSVPLQENHLAAVRYSLALELAPEYGVMPSPAVVQRQAEYFTGLQAFYANPSKMGVDMALNPYYGTYRA